MSKVLHLQTDSGLSGGISNYISAILYESKEEDNIIYYVAVPSLLENPDRAKILYNDSELLIMPNGYGVFGIFAYIVNLFRSVKKNKIDILHAHALKSAFPAAILSLITRVPLVYTNHGVRYIQIKPGAKRNLLKLIDKFVCSVASRIISVRDFDNIIVSRYSKSIANKSLVIKTRLSLNDLSFDAHGSIFGEIPRIVGVGSLISVKRPDRFIEWLNKLSTLGIRYKAEWFGDGPLKDELIKKAKLMGVNVNWRGQVEKTILLDELRTVKVLLVTSDIEVLPLCILEAFSRGVPVVSTFFTGADSLIEDGKTGYLVDADCPDLAAKRVFDLLNDFYTYRKISHSAKQKFESEYSDARLMVESYLNLYNSV